MILKEGSTLKTEDLHNTCIQLALTSTNEI